MEEFELPPFNEEAICPKCGYEGIQAYWQRSRKYAYIYSNEEDRETREHLRRTCYRCHYEWNESVLQEDK